MRLKHNTYHPRDEALDRVWQHTSHCTRCLAVGGLDSPASLLCAEGRALLAVWENMLVSNEGSCEL